MVAAGERIKASDIPDRVGVRLRRAANQSFSDAAAASISWDTEDEDTDGFWSSGATVTIPTGLGGVYAITAWATGTHVTGTRGYIEIAPTTAVTGTPANIRQTAGTIVENRFLVCATVVLEPADTFVINLFQDSSAAVNETGWMSCYRVSF